MVFLSLGMTSILVVYMSILEALYPHDKEEAVDVGDFLFEMTALFFCLALSPRLASRIYIPMGNATAQTCNDLSTKLLAHYGLPPNPAPEEPLPSDMEMENSSASNGCLLGIVLGGFGAYGSSLLCFRILGLEFTNPGKEEILAMCGPNMLIGITSGCVLGFTNGRLLYHYQKIAFEWQAHHEALTLLALNDMGGTRYFPPDVNDTIFSYQIGADEQTCRRLLNKTEDERSNGTGSVCHKFRFFPSYLAPSRQMIEDIEDRFSSAPLLPS